MTRIRRGVIIRARYKKTLKQARGYYDARSRVYHVAFRTVIKASQYACRDHRQCKRQFRQLRIAYISAAARRNSIPYDRLINGSKETSVEIDRKVLTSITVLDKITLTTPVGEAKVVLT